MYLLILQDCFWWFHLAGIHGWQGCRWFCLCLLYFYHNQSLKKFFPFIVLIVIVAVTNPLFVQRGRTILYADTHVRITKEALLYGIHYGCVLVNLLLVFSIFNQYIKKEQWIYLSGRFFPKLGVITSMAFGLIPRYQNHAKKILKTRKSLKSERAVQRVMHTNDQWKWHGHLSLRWISWIQWMHEATE